MDVNNRLRQRRNVIVQMRAESDMDDDPCIITLSNAQEDSSVFGPYLEECAGAPEGRGCYDAQMTTRDIRMQEFQICMEPSSANELWQSGGSEPCITQIEYPVEEEGYDLWGSNALPFEPLQVYTTNSVGQDNALCIVTTDNRVFVRSLGFNPSCEWVQVTNFIDADSNAIVVSKVVGFKDDETVIVLDEDNLAWELVRLTASAEGIPSSFVTPLTLSGDGVQDQPFTFLKSDYKMGGYLIGSYEHAPTTLLRSSSSFANDLGSMDWLYDNHPEGEDWIAGARTEDARIGIGSDGFAWSIGVNTEGFLGFLCRDHEDGEPYYAIITELMQIDYLGDTPNIVDVEMNETDELAASFLMTDSGITYSAGYAYYGGYNDYYGIIGRSVSEPLSHTHRDYPFGNVGSRFQSIKIGVYHVYAMHIDGSLWTWGRNGGLNEFGLKYTADHGHTGAVRGSRIPLLASYDTDWISLAVSKYDNHAIKLCSAVKGTFVASSADNFGQTVTEEFSSIYQSIGRNGFEYSSIGATHAIALDGDGIVYVSGAVDTYCMGGLSIGTGGIRYVGELQDVRRIWALKNNTAYLDGFNNFWVAGATIPRADDDSPPIVGVNYPEFTQIVLPDDSPVLDVQFNGTGVACLLENGTVYVWGSNPGYVLGTDASVGGIITTPTLINGAYQHISLGTTHGGGIGFTGALYMWGSDNGAPVYGLFGQSDNCTNGLEDIDIPPAEYTIPTRILIDNLYMSEAPSVFKEILCVETGTFVIINETDTEWMHDKTWTALPDDRVDSEYTAPRWCIGDVWGVGTGQIMTPNYESTTLVGCWAVILSGEGCFAKRCMWKDSYHTLEDLQRAYDWDNEFCMKEPALVRTFINAGYSIAYNSGGEEYLSYQTIFCQYYAMKFVAETFEGSHPACYADLYTQNTEYGVVVGYIIEGEGNITFTERDNVPPGLDEVTHYIDYEADTGYAAVVVLFRCENCVNEKPVPEVFCTQWTSSVGVRGDGDPP